jgi:ABC-2 type transport system ATP-binding protein
MTTVIETRGLEKRFGRVRALDGLDLTVEQGEVHGFLGPNGAGKSTTIRILLGLIRASGGTATVLGGDPWHDAVRLHSRIAYVPGDVSLWPNLSGGEAIDLLARLRGASTRATAFRRRRAELLDAFALDPRVKTRNYSKGNRQKVALVAAFAVPAELYVLDEPTSGLDPLMEAVFTTEVGRLQREGGTVLLSSHILSEVERLCERVSIVRAGRIVERGTLTELRHLTRTQFGFVDDGLDLAELGRADAVHDLLREQGRVAFTTDSDRVDAVLPLLAQLKVRGLTVAPPSLEELFLRHYGDRIPETAEAGDKQIGAPSDGPATETPVGSRR